MSEQYVPSGDQVRGRYCDGAYLQTGHTTGGDGFDAWLARVRRDAAREAEAERDEWRQTALDERGAALDALEQIKVRDARIKAVRNVLDRHAHYGLVEADAIRRALNGYTET